MADTPIPSTEQDHRIASAQEADHRTVKISVAQLKQYIKQASDIQTLEAQIKQLRATLEAAQTQALIAMQALPQSPDAMQAAPTPHEHEQNLPLPHAPSNGAGAFGTGTVPAPLAATQTPFTVAPSDAAPLTVAPDGEPTTTHAQPSGPPTFLYGVVQPDPLKTDAMRADPVLSTHYQPPQVPATPTSLRRPGDRAPVQALQTLPASQAQAQATQAAHATEATQDIISIPIPNEPANPASPTNQVDLLEAAYRISPPPLPTQTTYDSDNKPREAPLASSRVQYAEILSNVMQFTQLQAELAGERWLPFPNMMTPENTQIIMSAVEMGMPRHSACALVGIPRYTFYHWRDNAAEGKEPYNSFMAMFELAEARNEATYVAVWNRAAKESWKASKELLQLRHKENWTPTTRTELTPVDIGRMTLQDLERELGPSAVKTINKQLTLAAEQNTEQTSQSVAEEPPYDAFADDDIPAIDAFVDDDLPEIIVTQLNPNETKN